MKRYLLLLASCVATLTLILVSFAPAADMPVKAQRSVVVAAETVNWTGAYIEGFVGVGQSKGSVSTDGISGSSGSSGTDAVAAVPGTPDTTTTTTVCTNPKGAVVDCAGKTKNKTVTVTTVTTKGTPGTPGSPATSGSSGTSGIAGQSADTNMIGVMIGAGAGYDWQVAPQGLVGLELDGAWSDVRGSNGGLNRSMNWLFSGTARAGWLATPTALLYVKGGAALARFESSFNGIGSSDTTKFGWTLGGGLEWRMSQILSTKIEADYYRFSDQNVVFPGGTATLKNDVTVVKAVLARRF